MLPGRFVSPEFKRPASRVGLRPRERRPLRRSRGLLLELRPAATTAMGHPAANMVATCHSAANGGRAAIERAWQPRLSARRFATEGVSTQRSGDVRNDVPPPGVLDDHGRYLCGIAAAIRVAAAHWTESVGKTDASRDFFCAGRTDGGAPVSGAGSVALRTVRCTRQPPRATPCATCATSDPGAVSTALVRGSPVSDLTAQDHSKVAVAGHQPPILPGYRPLFGAVGHGRALGEPSIGTFGWPCLTASNPRFSWAVI